MASSSALLAPNLASRRRDRMLPLLTLGIILSLFTIYLSLHVLPALNRPVDTDVASESGITIRRAEVELVAMLVLTALVLTSMFRTCFTDPGAVPEGREWRIEPEDRKAEVGHDVPADEAFPAHNYQESKRSGDRRQCKHCYKYKPDRSHHCSTCSRCVLKMDHHCVYLATCVGFGNYKYFFLLLFYATMTNAFLCATMMPSVVEALVDSENYHMLTMFLLLFGETLGLTLLVVTTGYLVFHAWLVCTNRTIIEYFEKRRSQIRGRSVYHVGLWGNLKAGLGDNPLLWFLPLAPPSGPGTSFLSPATRLSADVATSAEVKRRGHRRAEWRDRDPLALRPGVL